MKATELVLAIAVCLPAWAQTGIIMSGSGGSGSMLFSFETRHEPPSPVIKGLGRGGVMVGQGGAHRFMMDPSTRRVFGYDIEIEPLKETDSYRITFGPLDLIPDDPAVTVIPLPANPAPQTVRRGDAALRPAWPSRLRIRSS